MIRRLVAAGFLFAMTAAADPAVAQGRPAEAARVVTYNIRFDNPADDPTWAERAPHLAAQVSFLAADVIGLQEALMSQVADLASAWPQHDHYGLGRDDGATAGETTTIFWRRDRFEPVTRQTVWCSPTPDRPSVGWDAALPRTVTRVVLRDRRSGLLLDVRNAHFDHVGAEARRRCAMQIAAWPAAVVGERRAAVVVLGDLNAPPGSPPYQALVDAGFGDARDRANVVFGPTGTYNAFDGARGVGQPAIDHILVAADLAVSRFAVLTDTLGGRVLSDHFPVVADLTTQDP